MMTLQVVKGAPHQEEAQQFVNLMLGEEFQKALKAEGIDTTRFKDNFWHYVPNWEHFLAKSTAQTKNPFKDPRNRKATYSRKSIPHAEDLLGRTLIMGICVKMPAARMKAIRKAIANAARVL